MGYRYILCDVFTETRFGGNQLAVLPDARGLSAHQMQQIAREFNFSESTFVLPPEAGNTRRVRIFTPTVEIPFAGHPNVGTAFALAATGELGDFGPSTTVTFEEKAGIVPVAIQRGDGDAIRCELTAPEPLSLGESVAPPAVAAAVSLSERDIVTRTHPPQAASVGLPFVFAELTDRAALERARPDTTATEALAAAGIPDGVHVYVRSGDEFDIRARVFVPLDGVPEDPATGSANAALAGLLAHCAAEPTASLAWRIAQGVEMGRPSVLDARAEKQDGTVVSTGVGGNSVLVGVGTLEVD